MAKQSDVENLKTSVSSGKAQIASAITDKGVSTSSTASFSTMASNISSLSITPPELAKVGSTCRWYVDMNNGYYGSTANVVNSEDRIIYAFRNTTYRYTLSFYKDYVVGGIYIGWRNAYAGTNVLATIEIDSTPYCGPSFPPLKVVLSNRENGGMSASLKSYEFIENDGIYITAAISLGSDSEYTYSWTNHRITQTQKEIKIKWNITATCSYTSEGAYGKTF